ncbi:MAG: bifunctional enoyl-CoA hydratase/phosphate acetyltransferase [Anaerolineae bacterium]|nr:bifunctional enoyl-CoA hydratase/phosphate acetyltransferase [Anaerolineae bacterium]
MAFANLDDLVDRAASLPPCHVAVAAAHDPEVLRSIDEAQKRGVATADLIGDAQEIERIATKNHLDLLGVIIEDQTDTQLAARRAMAMVREGRANVVVKGQIKTAEFMRAALDREHGIRDKTLLSHIGVFEIAGWDRLLLMSDSGVVLYPTTEQKLVIIQNAVDVARKLAIDTPLVAILSANEHIHPARPAGIEALALARMAQEGWVHDAIVDGPLPLDAAVDPACAERRGIGGPVAGHADIVIVPNVEAGNIAAKAILYLGGGHMAGMVVGARVPIIINSRADDATTRLRSIAMAALVARS